MSNKSLIICCLFLFASFAVFEHAQAGKMKKIENLLMALALLKKKKKVKILPLPVPIPIVKEKVVYQAM